MDNKHKQLKKHIEIAYQRIAEYEKVIKEIREQCQHPSYHLSTYQWGGPGHTSEIDLCDVCGSPKTPPYTIYPE